MIIPAPSAPDTTSLFAAVALLDACLIPRSFSRLTHQPLAARRADSLGNSRTPVQTQARSARATMWRVTGSSDWHLRTPPPELARRYLAEGRWTDDSLGTLLS